MSDQSSPPSLSPMFSAPAVPQVSHVGKRGGRADQSAVGVINRPLR